MFGRSQSYEPKGVRRVPVGSAAYMSRHESAIPVDEAFLFKYFVESGRRTDGTGVNARANAEDVEDLDSDEADEFLGDIDNHVSSCQTAVPSNYPDDVLLHNTALFCLKNTPIFFGATAGFT